MDRKFPRVAKLSAAVRPTSVLQPAQAAPPGTIPKVGPAPKTSSLSMASINELLVSLTCLTDELRSVLLVHHERLTDIGTELAKETSHSEELRKHLDDPGARLTAMEGDLVTFKCDANKLLDFVNKAGPETLVRGAPVE